MTGALVCLHWGSNVERIPIVEKQNNKEKVKAGLGNYIKRELSLIQQ